MPSVDYLLAPDVVVLSLRTFLSHGFIIGLASTEFWEAVEHDALEQCLSNHVW